MIIARKHLAEITEMCMELKESVRKVYKNYTLIANPEFHEDDVYNPHLLPEDKSLVGIVINWFSTNHNVED